MTKPNFRKKVKCNFRAKGKPHQKGLFFVLISIAAFVIMVQQGKQFKRSYSIPNVTRAHISTNYYIDQTQICNRVVPNSSLFRRDQKIQDGVSSTKAPIKRKLVILGWNGAFGQTNNQINTIFHAMDYAVDIDAHLAIVRDTWPNHVLQLLFDGMGSNTSLNNGVHPTDTWEKAVVANLGVLIVNKDEISTKYSHMEVYFNTSKEMYYYHTKVSPSEIKKRRVPIIRYLWTHPTNNKEMLQDQNVNVCSVVNNISVQLNESKYTVVHSRWMNGECTKRMSDLAHHIRKNYWNTTRNSTQRMLDKIAPCELPPSYIKYIIMKNDMLHKPIYVITNGERPDIIQRLQADHIIGKDVYSIPSNVTSVGGDMMLGILANVFIGAPTSTMSGNIARARAALGFHPSTNYLFPLSNQSHNEWEFFCDNDDCLYDSSVITSYVG